MFSGRAAFVTGGGTGIGFACAETIVRHGGVVTIAGRRTEVLEDAAGKLGDGADWVQCDITNTESVHAAVATAAERHGALHLAVNSAYAAMMGSFRGTLPDLFAMTTDGTLNGTFRAMQAEGEAIHAAGGGSIVNISSFVSARPGRWGVAYAASKAGVDVLTRVAADEWGHLGVRVNSVLPGLIRTDTASPLTKEPDVQVGFARQTPMRRLGEPEDIAQVVTFLLSDAASFVTGQCICVDGGLSLRGLPEPEHKNALRNLVPDFFAGDEPF